jgi:hypothetical protein
MKIVFYLYKLAEIRSTTDFGSRPAPKAEILFTKPGMISGFLWNIPFKPMRATASGCMLNFSASSASMSRPARLAKPVSVGPGDRQVTETVLSFSSYLSARV